MLVSLIRVSIAGWAVTDGWVGVYIYNYCDGGGDSCGATAGRKDVKRRPAFVRKTCRLDSSRRHLYYIGCLQQLMPNYYFVFGKKENINGESRRRRLR